MYLLDTNVVSELRKLGTERAEPAVESWNRSVDARSLYLSAITLQELEIGVLRKERKDAKQGAALRYWLNLQLLPSFEGRVLEVDQRVALASARLQVPDPRPILDCLIAATAIAFGLTLVTRNTIDFACAGLTLVDPWLFTG